MTGTVQWFDESKGFGQIRAEGGSEVSVHYSEIRCDGFRTLTQGEEVEFELRETEQGASSRQCESALKGLPSGHLWAAWTQEAQSHRYRLFVRVWG